MATRAILRELGPDTDGANDVVVEINDKDANDLHGNEPKCNVTVASCPSERYVPRRYDGLKLLHEYLGPVVVVEPKGIDPYFPVKNGSVLTIAVLDR